MELATDPAAHLGRTWADLIGLWPMRALWGLKSNFAATAFRIFVPTAFDFFDASRRRRPFDVVWSPDPAIWERLSAESCFRNFGRLVGHNVCDRLLRDLGPTSFG